MKAEDDLDRSQRPQNCVRKHGSKLDPNTNSKSWAVT